MEDRLEKVETEMKQKTGEFEKKGMKECYSHLPFSSSSHRHKHVLAHTYTNTHAHAEFIGIEREQRGCASCEAGPRDSGAEAHH